MHLSAIRGRDSHGQEAQRGHQGRGEHRTEPCPCSFLDQSFQVEAIAATQADELIHQHKSVEHRHTEQCDETYACRNAERQRAQLQGQYPTYCGQRHRCENDQCLAHRIEGQIEQEKDEQQRYWHGYHQAGGGVLQVLELPSVGDGVAWGKVELGIQTLFYLTHQRGHIAVPHVDTDGYPALGILPRNHHRPFGGHHFSDLRQRNMRAIGGVDEHTAQIQTFAVGRCKA